MPSKLSCPNCGSPLPFDAKTPVVVCRYCNGHVPRGEGANASPAPAPESRRKDKQPSRRSRESRTTRPDATRRALGIAFALLGLAATAGVVVYTRSSAQRSSDEEPPAEVTLRKVDLGATPAAIADLLGKAPDTTSRITRDFEKGIVRRAEVQWDKADGSHASKVTLFFRAGRFDPKPALDRLRTIVPNRVEPHSATSHRLFVGDSVLDVSSDTLTVWHWTSVHPAGIDRAACGEHRAAFWAAARFAALDGPSPTAAQIELVNGPALRTVTRLDHALTVEQVAGEINRTFPAGRCSTQAGVVCQVDVDHPIVKEVRWRWPNAVKGRVREATFSLRSPRDAAKIERAIAGCLQSVLGSGEESVTDYVKGTRTWIWRIGERGDKATLAPGSLRLSEPDDAKPEAPAGWPDRFAEIVGALDRCAI